MLIASMLTAPPPAAASEPAAAAAACRDCLSFETTHVNTPAPARRAFAYVERIWSAAITTGATVRIRVSFVPLEARATTIPRPVLVDGGAGGAAWYPSSLARALDGPDARGDALAHDMEIFFSSEADWYYGTDGGVPGDLVDFVSVALHEVAHGLGFASRMSLKRGGSFSGFRPGGGIPDLSFEIPDMRGLPTIFDHFIETAQGERPMSIGEGDAQSVALGKAVLDGRLYFGGAHAAARSGGRRARLSAVDPSHVDQKTYEWSSDGLMTSRALPGRAVHEPGEIVLGVLEDLGWRTAPIDPGPATAEAATNKDARVASVWTTIH
jgi:hypothetical protein